MAANTDAPFGFRYIQNLTGGDERLRTFIHAAADGVAIGRGDLVTVTGAADTVEQYDNNDPIHALALNYVALSVLGDVSCVFLNHTSVMECQEDSDGGSIAAASEALNAGVIVGAANTTTGLSIMEIDSSSAATTATLGLRLLQPSPRVGNTVATSNAIWYVSPLELNIAEGKAGV